MEIKKSTLQNILFFIVVGILVIGFFVFILGGEEESSTSESTGDNSVVTMEGEKQIIDLTAKGGYSPRVIEAKANVDTILRVTTKNTFDCSTAFRIPELGVKETLPINGKTEFEIKAQEPGSEIDGTCSMGMYSFTIKFV